MNITQTPPPTHSFPAITPVTPGPSLPNSIDQSLTSRFLSPSTTGGSSISRRNNNAQLPRTPPDHNAPPPTSDIPPPALNRSESTYSISATSTVPSRTQKKLWLQRASSQYDLVSAQQSLQPTSGSSLYNPLPLEFPHHTHTQGRTQKDIFDRVAREYRNVRRFQNPVLEGFDRVLEREGKRDRGVVMGRRRVRVQGGGGGEMGMSRSLQEGVGAKVGVKVGSRDDSGLGMTGQEGGRRERGVEIEKVLGRLWRKSELLVSNE